MIHLRKEPVLFLLTLLVGGYVYLRLRDEDGPLPMFRPVAAAYEPAAVPPVVLADATPVPLAKVVKRELWREPSETQPLPPVSLPFPMHSQLTIAALPLPIGPGYGHLQMLRLPGDPVEGVTLEAAAAPAVADAAPVPAAPQNRKEGFARIYDRVWPTVGGDPWFGILELDGVDKYELESRSDFSDAHVKLRRLNTASGKIEDTMSFGPGEIKKVQLADNLRNEIERRKRKVPKDAGYLKQRGELIEWLLQQAKQELWVYDEAMAQADQYLKDTGNDLEGLQWKVRVLRAKGAFGEELKFYQGLEGRNANSWFQAEGIGQLYQKLGLLVPAEANLRRAVELAPTDSRPRATLAILLHEQHRDREALEQSQRSFAGINAVTAPADKVRIATALISCQLTDGDVAGARSTVASAGEAATPYLRGCVDYAAGELQTALDQFRVAAAGADGNVALLGVAASLLGLKQWQEAQAAFETVADQAPLLRHRAFSGMALLDLRLGQRDRAMSHLDRALEANPLDSYCHYLRGRVLREQGQIGPALDEQTTVLHHHDDFVHAIAEVALLHGQLAREGGGEQQAEHFVAAVRYIDRAVDLARPPLQELCEQQGLLHFDSADLRGAAAAFTAARDLATDDPGRLFARSALALCDYAQGGADEARTQLQRMGGDLPKDAPIRTWAEATVERIDDHSQKEQLDDHFERTDLGKVWLVEGAGNLAPSIVDGELAFNGPFGKIGAITVGRDGAVKKASNFLAVECRMQLKPGHQRNDSFAGVMLELQKAQGSGQSDFRVKLGIRDGQAWYRLEDGRSEPLQIICKPNGFDAAAWQTLQIRIVPLGDRNQNQFGLVLLWNGQPLLTEPRRLDSLRPNMAAELRTMLTVESGKKDSQVDVRFDDYHLERRKENP